MSIFVGNKNNKKIFSINKSSTDTHETPNDNTVFHSSLPYLEVETFTVPRISDYNNPYDAGSSTTGYSNVARYDINSMSIDRFSNRAYLIVINGKIAQPYFSVIAGGDYEEGSVGAPERTYYLGGYNPFATMNLGRAEMYVPGSNFPSNTVLNQGASLSPDFTTSILYIPVGGGNAGLYNRPPTLKVQIIVLKNIYTDQNAGYRYAAPNNRQDNEIKIDNTQLSVNGENIIDKEYLAVLPSIPRISNYWFGKEINPSEGVATAITNTIIGTHYFYSGIGIWDKRWIAAMSKDPTEVKNINVDKATCLGIGSWFEMATHNTIKSRDMYHRGNNTRYRTTPTIDGIVAPIFQVLKGSKAGPGLKLEDSGGDYRLTVGNNIPLFDKDVQLLRRVDSPTRLNVPAVNQNITRTITCNQAESQYISNTITLTKVLVKKSSIGDNMPFIYSITSPYAAVAKMPLHTSTAVSSQYVDYSRIFSAGARGVHSGLMNMAVGGRAIFYTLSNSHTSWNARFTVTSRSSFTEKTNKQGVIYFERGVGNSTHDWIYVRARLYHSAQKSNYQYHGSWNETVNIRMPGFTIDIMPLL